MAWAWHDKTVGTALLWSSARPHPSSSLQRALSVTAKQSGQACASQPRACSRRRYLSLSRASQGFYHGSRVRHGTQGHEHRAQGEGQEQSLRARGARAFKNARRHFAPTALSWGPGPRSRACSAAAAPAPDVLKPKPYKVYPVSRSVASTLRLGSRLVPELLHLVFDGQLPRVELDDLHYPHKESHSSGSLETADRLK